MKTCTKCGVEKPLDDYHNNKRTRDGKGSWCKECVLAEVGRRGREGRKLLNSIKLDKGCEICGYREHPAALHFDHIDPSNKHANVGQMIASLEETILSEVAKCRVLCANCHMIHTHDPDFHNKDPKQLDLLE